MIAGYRMAGPGKSGGMGVVYEAVELAPLERTVAIKVIRPDLAEDAAFRARFKREAKVVARLSHPNIIEILTFHEDLGLIVMPFIGADLGGVLRRSGPLTPAAAVDAVCQIAQALDAAHAAGSVHGDVKPANVLVSGTHMLLTDFGLTEAFGARGGDTLAGVFLGGTPAYMPPEQLVSAPPSRSGDIYALGVVLYQLLTGTLPPANPTGAAPEQGAPVPPGAAAPGIPVALEAVVAQALHRDPHRRYASAGELANAAAEALGDESGKTVVVKPGPPPRGPRRPRARATVVACGLVAAIGLAFMAGRWSVAPPPRPAVVVSFSYSTGYQKRELLEPLIEQFNRERHMLGERAIFVDAQHDEDKRYTSGEAEQMIRDRQLTPTAWSPADGLWGEALNFAVGERWAPSDSPALVSSATTIAMWEPLARAIGWPERRLGWADVLTLSLAGKVPGRPDLGPLKFAHSVPATSTTGLQATAAEYLFAAGKRRGLTVADVRAEPARRKVRAIERAIEHYAESAVGLEDQLRIARLQDYANVAALGEVAVLGVNRDRRKQGERLVSIYPKEGILLREEPYYVLDAPWVDADERRAARAFGEYLAEEITPDLAMSIGYRPGDRNAELPARRVTEWLRDGVDPRRQATLTMPQPQVLAAIQRAWKEDRKPARVQIVLDTSKAMSGGRLNRARKGLRKLLAQVAPQDQLGLITSSGVPRVAARLGRPFEDARDTLVDSVERLPSAAGGDSVAYDAIEAAVDALTSPRSSDTIDAVVLLTSGDDTESGTRYAELLARLRAERKARHPVRLYVIYYGSDDEAAGRRADIAGAARFRMLAEATGGHGYDEQRKSLTDVYRDIPLGY